MLLKNKLKKFLSLGLVVIIALTLSQQTAFAQDLRKDSNTIYPITSEGGTFEVELTRNADGKLIGSALLSASSSSVDAGAIKFSLDADFTISNLYSVSYSAIATDYFNGIRGNLIITNTSILNPKTYMSREINSTFSATKIRYDGVGSIIIPLEVKKVHLRFNNSSIYFLKYGWCFGINLINVYSVK
jgi:hypothetical protein